MKTWLRISTLCAVLLIVGCNTANNQQEPEEEVNGEEKQEDSDAEQTSADDDAEQEVEGEGVDNEDDRLAVEHEFTKSFLVETDVEPGFHQMRGKLDGFEMLIPENAIIPSMLHVIENNKIETLIYAINNNLEKKQYNVQVIYQSKYPQELKQNYLNVFKDEMGFEDEYVRVEANDLEIYYGKVEDKDEYGPVLKYFGYLFSKEQNQAISYEFMAMCQGKEECDISLEEEAEVAEKLMYSIRLLDQ
ncbi:hypothetical protein [Shouchella lehensis]|uniref:Lipoprotein YvcA n=1 Tax=Shouchella lehensis TaxID=300825 RepID=A0A4Y7WF55_9BACI|nr:hypothetical protein [Shouchella lehensis]MBG9784997.1 hypothetical protein [Shouchella lehensis]TES46419.1 hypothetical protein E2L03_17125 [Shouchella lehensis]